LTTAQAIISPSADAPPNYQWLGRTAYLFPWWNMVMYGMGLPLGLAAWAFTAIALIRLLYGKPGALNNLMLLVWILGYFLFMGRNWVLTMRYFLPLYPALIVMAAWGIVWFLGWARARAGRGRVVWRAAAYALLILVPAFSLLWALAYTNVYRNMLTRVQASYWVMENLPGDFAMQIDTGDNRMVTMNDGDYQTTNVPLINIAVPNRYGNENDLLSRATQYDTFMPTSSNPFTATDSGVISSILAPHLGDATDDPGPEVMQFTVRRQSDGAVVGTATLDQNLTRNTSPVGDPVEILFDEPFTVELGERYVFEVQYISGGPVVSGGTLFTWEGAWDDPIPTKVCTPPLGVSLADDPPPGLIAAGYDCNGRDPWWGLVLGFEQDTVYEDDAAKREKLLLTLDQSDYIGISSNRFYDTLSRNPLRWPMTNVYYEALFSGALGWELVGTFQETYQLGPLRLSDQHLPIYDSPDWLNEWESEEAFSVYDHPVVFIFRRTEAYDPLAARDILEAVPLTRVNEGRVFYNCAEDPDLYFCDPVMVGPAGINTEQGDRAPTGLMLTDSQAETQSRGGTWSERFDSASPINTNEALGVVVWWLAIWLFGLAAFPLLFALLPGLEDRGYGAAKFMGMFFVSWGVWMLASARLPVWSQAGIAVGMIVLGLLGLALAWRQRGELVTWMRQHWKRLLVIDLLTLALFAAFVLVRLSNPDLWHDSFGGEKPMDFAYFNAVLRSTIFPPYDPWYAGGYINYYYFGFVIVGVPVLLLKMIPAFAFNLILPTLFAATGMGAFTVAFSLVAWLRRSRFAVPGSAWGAGIAAIFLAVVVGNLDTPRVALTGLARMGGYEQPAGLESFLIDEYLAERQGSTPPDADLLAIAERAQQSNFTDRLRYELDGAGEIVRSIGAGLGRVLAGDPLYISPDRWFWGPSRVLAETPGVEGSAITEMPAFTFIYGDLHAHMISMPMQLFVLAFVLNEILIVGRDKRGRAARWLAIAAGAIVVGMLRATNTWDWITYILFGALGLGFAWWLRWRSIGRWSLLDLMGRNGGFFIISFLAVLPFTTWFASAYSSVRPWTDGRTPLWAYFDIHGLFLFLILSLLVWETGRWLRAEKVGSLRGKGGWLLALIAVVVAAIVVSIAMALLGVQVALIALPMLVWVAVLFFRRGQNRAMQYVLALVGLGIALTLGVELIVLEGDIGRQNTVFKFYMQVWLMFSVVGGAALAWLWSASESWSAKLRVPWTGLLVLLVAVASMFPLMATRGKASFRMAPELPVTLDGMAFMQQADRWEGDSDVLALHPERAPFQLADDYALIRWLQENIEGTPTIIEGLGDDTQYRWNGRISIYTGLPTVLGWNFHQRQQRGLDPMPRMVEMRNANVNAFYETGSIGVAWDMIGHYGIEYIIVGEYERAYVNDAGLAKFEEMVGLGLIEPVFTVGNSTIYRVIPGAQIPAVG
jgi:YYY domain-containing protein